MSDDDTMTALDTYATKESLTRAAMLEDDVFGLRNYSCNAPPVEPFDSDSEVDAHRKLAEVFCPGPWRIDAGKERRSAHHESVVDDVKKYGKSSLYAQARCPYLCQSCVFVKPPISLGLRSVLRARFLFETGVLSRSQLMEQHLSRHRSSSGSFRRRQRYSGVTALHACAINGFLSLLRALVEFGRCDPLDVAEHLADLFDKRIEKARGADALWMAKRRGHRDCVDYLLSLTVVQDALGTVHVDTRTRDRMAKEEEVKRRELFVKNVRGLGRRVEDRRDRERVRSRALTEGARVRLLKSGDKATVRYVGPVDYTRGTMVGLALDREGSGKHNGSVKGREYFACEPRCGLMVQPSDVQLDDVDYAVMVAVDTLPRNPQPKIDYFPSKVVDEKRRLSRMTVRKSSFSGLTVADRLMGRSDDSHSTRAFQDARGAAEGALNLFG